MKLAFGPALPVGTAGENEYFDVWLTRYSESAELLQRLAAVSPAELAPTEARFIADGQPSLGAALTIGVYRVDIEGKEELSGNAQAALDAVIAKGTLEVEHKGKTKVFDLARSIPKEPRAVGRQDGVEISFAVRMGPDGSLRPEALVRAALDASGLEASAVRTTRLDTLVEDEDGAWSRPV
jgi:radical SAM-linked protein